MLKIGFDFDKVFVNYPPLVPDFIIDRIYKKADKKLSYRFPGKIEQQIRIASHAPFLRLPIKSNINSLAKISKENKYELYLISSRFGFLEKRTNEWLKKNNFKNYFKHIYFNFGNGQPHEFKNDMIQKHNIDIYIDDDLDTLNYLAENNKNKTFYWLIKKSFFLTHKLPTNVIPIKDIEEFRVEVLEKI